ncbi:MAG: hypothetical protein U0228_09360 [Myxococcaceae bacterium]
MTGLLSIAMLIAAPVLAADPVVPVQADVVYASTTAGQVDPALTRMRDAMASKVKYQTMKKLDGKKLELVKDKTQTVALPNQKTAEVVLQSVSNDNVATLKVKLPPTEATYSLAREKALYLQGGPHDGGDLWLVLSQPK